MCEEVSCSSRRLGGNRGLLLCFGHENGPSMSNRDDSIIHQLPGTVLGHASQLPPSRKPLPTDACPRPLLLRRDLQNELTPKYANSRAKPSQRSVLPSPAVPALAMILAHRRSSPTSASTRNSSPVTSSQSTCSTRPTLPHGDSTGVVERPYPAILAGLASGHAQKSAALGS